MLGNTVVGVAVAARQFRQVVSAGVRCGVAAEAEVAAVIQQQRLLVEQLVDYRIHM
jgi:hypothetical protein